jgi:hypothetical protein
LATGTARLFPAGQPGWARRLAGTWIPITPAPPPPSSGNGDGDGRRSFTRYCSIGTDIALLKVSATQIDRFQDSRPGTWQGHRMRTIFDRLVEEFSAWHLFDDLADGRRGPERPAPGPASHGQLARHRRDRAGVPSWPGGPVNGGRRMSRGS